MKVLILSCNTGEGHNAAGRALRECLEKRGYPVVMYDYMQAAGRRTGKLVSGAYIGMAKHAPGLFYLLYKTAEHISSKDRKSPVYYANTLMGRHLQQYLDENDFDIIVMPHLFPAETVTYLKNRGQLTQKTLAVSTDYTCVPFWEETDCDGYVVPHEDLIAEYTYRGIDADKLFALGIPVSEAFAVHNNGSAARQRLSLPVDKTVYLIMCGSMGFGRVQLFTYELYKKCKDGEHIVVICGNNTKLRFSLEKIYKNSPNVHIIGYTDQVSEYMEACDVIYSKPGGLTSTEAVVKNRPLVHTAPIPGCETKNMEFFASHGMSVTSKRMYDQVDDGQILACNKLVRDHMLLSQREHAKPTAASDIVDLMLKFCGETEQHQS